MLLNPSHKVTFSGLPPDVLDSYVRYKKGTRALVAWFIQYSPSPKRRVKSLPIKELASLAKAVADSTKSIPDVIHFHFRETIAARKRLSKHFRGQVDHDPEDLDTINHEHFTSSLAQIYADLCACCEKPVQINHVNLARKSALSTNQLTNHYQNLPIEDVEDHGAAEETFTSSECSECLAEPLSSCSSTGLEVTFVGDELGEALEITEAVQRLQELSDSVEQCWKLAGEGQLSITTAALTTNVAFASVRQIGAELIEYDGKLSISGLHRLCCSLDLQEGQPDSHSLLTRLQEIEKVLSHYRDGHRLSPIRSCPSCMQKPADYIQSPADEDGNAPGNFDAAIIDNILHLVTDKVPPTSIIRGGTPVYTDVGYLVTHATETPQSWSAVLGLHLLTLGYKTHVYSMFQPKLISKCRLAALRLAQAAQSHVSAVLNDKTCFPCRCTQTLAYHLQNLEGELQNFAKHNCWDLYFQSPWVAGNHILEILDLCHYYGMRLSSYRHYVGAVLHSYNVLKELAGLGGIPILESLCDEFRDVFFPSGMRPKSNFRSSWDRYVGARLKFKKGHHSRNSRDGWCMAIPPHAARRAAGLGSAPELKMACLLFKIKKHDYHIGDNEWEALDKIPERSCPESPGRRTQPLTQPAEVSITGPRLLRLADTIDRSLTATDDTALPPARLNLLAVFQSCVRIVARLSDETHRGKDEQGINCVCFASAILAGGDRIVDGRRLGRLEAWKKDERACISQASAAITEAFGGTGGMDQWLWDI